MQIHQRVEFQNYSPTTTRTKVEPACVEGEGSRNMIFSFHGLEKKFKIKEV